MDEARPPLSIEPLGESAFACQIPAPISLDRQRWIWGFDDAVRGAMPAVQTSVGMNNLTVLFDALSDPPPVVRDRLEALWRGGHAAGEPGEPVEIPVAYGGAEGPDLADVAHHCGLTQQEVVRLHAQSTYTVFFVGFLPGFAYLGELDARLATPRLAQPRIRVPAGSVAIGGNQTGIYPSPSPGGWRLIGRTDRVLFDPRRSPPALLRAGSLVRFVIARTAPC
jgi:KipI family sensor histidine kinase inhibitor